MAEITGATTVAVVLVHGGFVDGSGWEDVYKILKKDGYSVSIVHRSAASAVACRSRRKSRSPRPVQWRECRARRCRRALPARDDVHLDLRRLVRCAGPCRCRSCLCSTRPSFSVISPYRAAVSPVYDAAPPIWATTVSGLTTVPQSTAQTTRSDADAASSATSTSATWAT